VRPGKQAWDVFQEHKPRPNLRNRANGFRPHVAAVHVCFTLSSDTEWLTGESRCNDINQALICCGESLIVECSDIAEDWGPVKDSIVDPCCQHALTIIIPLDIADSTPAKELASQHTTAGAGE
jgi:hypothetical protein